VCLPRLTVDGGAIGADEEVVQAAVAVGGAERVFDAGAAGGLGAQLPVGMVRAVRSTTVMGTKPLPCKAAKYSPRGWM
jgi:hypothetical protein